MTSETKIEDVYAVHERRATRKMKIVVGFFGAVILLIFVIIVVG